MLSSQERVKFSEESQGWLTAALDPYHDYQYEVSGLPDERSAPSTVQIHNQSYSLTAPTSASGGVWDASILYTGVNSVIGRADLGGMISVAVSCSHPWDNTARSAGQPFGALNLWAGAAGAVMSTGAPTVVGDTYASLGSVLTTDRCRLIGVAFEVHNTTAEVYKQGSLTVAQLPDVACDSSLVTYFDTAASFPIPVTVCQADRAFVQASTLAPLMTVPGSSTWPAAEGVYAVPRMVMVPRDIYLYGDTPGGGVASRVPILYGTDGKVATPEPRGQIGFPGSQQAGFNAYNPSGFSPIQVRCTGLSSQTTLTVTFRTIVEYFPALGSPLLPTSRPSPASDPAVLGCYSSIVTEAPYAVPVAQNAAGDYFRKILKVMSTAMTVSSPLFGAYAPLVQSLATAGRMWADRPQKKDPQEKKVQRREAGAPALQLKRRN